jgi:ribonuclease P protein component
VYRRGRSASSRHLVVYAFARDPGATASEPRVGLTVSRKVGGSVERNRVKRLLREASARVTPSLAANVDLVIVARPGLAESLAEERLDWLEAEVRELAERAAGSPA